MSSRAGIVERAIDIAFSFVLVSTALAVVFAHRGLAPLLALLALIIALRPTIWRAGFSLLDRGRIVAEPFPKAVLAMALFTALIATSAAWSPTPGAIGLALMHLLAMLVCGAVVHEAAYAEPGRARRLATIYALAVSVAAALLMFEGLSGGYLRAIVPPEDFSHLRWKDMTALARGVGAAALMALPAAAIIRILTKSWIAAFAPAAALMIAAMNFTITTNTASLGLALLAFVAAFTAPRASLIAIAAMIVLTIVLAPLFSFVPVDRMIEAADLPASWAQRLLVWQTVAERSLSDCMPFGCGADYARAWSLEGRMIEVKGSTIALQEIPTHPHNVFLQIWLELGPAGAALLALSSLFGARALLRLEIPRLTAGAIAAVAAALYCSFMVEASLWQVWRFAAAALAIVGAALSYAVKGRGIVNAWGGGLN